MNITKYLFLLLILFPISANAMTVDIGYTKPASVADAPNKTADADFVTTTSGNNALLGWSAKESAGTPALTTAVIRDDTTGATCDGTALAYIHLAASTSQQGQLPIGGASFSNGLCLDVLAGEIDVSVTYYSR